MLALLAHTACSSKSAQSLGVRAIRDAAADGTSCAGDSSAGLQPALTARAGAGATDCGHVILDAGPDMVDACVVAAFRNHEPFFAEYDRRGNDSKLAFGLAGDAQGHVTFLYWDGDPSGGSGWPPVIDGVRCNTPSVDPSATRDSSTTSPLNCVSTTSLGRICG
jgi:hypothetical protein